MVWFAAQDGFVITQKMTDEEVWYRCNMFGSPTLAEAIEIWLLTSTLFQDSTQQPPM